MMDNKAVSIYRVEYYALYSKKKYIIRVCLLYKTRNYSTDNSRKTLL